MDPSGSLLWHATELGSTTLYTPEPPTDEDRIFELLITAPTGDLLAKGVNGGRIYLPPEGQPENVVIKEFGPSVTPNPGNLADLRLNVLLGVGLDMVAQNDSFWRIRGASIKGAAVFKAETRLGGTLYARWVMERIVSVANAEDFLPPDPERKPGRSMPSIEKLSSPPLPPQQKLVELHDRALAAATKSDFESLRLKQGIFPYDLTAENIIIERLPELGEQDEVIKKGSAVRIDALVVEGFNF